MSDLRRCALMALALGLAAGTAAAPPRFVGVLTLGDRCWFALAEPGQPAEWREMGGGFDRYVIAGYQAEDAVLLLRCGAASSWVPLETARVRRWVTRIDVRALAERYFAAMGEQLDVDEPRPFKDRWLVIGHREVAGRTESHTLLVSQSGAVLQSLRNPADGWPR